MINAKRLLSDLDASPLLIIAVLQKEFGPEWLDWEPEVLWDEIENKFGISIREQPRAMRDKIMASRVSVTSNVPWLDWHPFLATVQAFNGISPKVEYAEPAQLGHLAYGIQTLKRIQPENTFDRDVRFTIAAHLHAEGLCWVPDEPIGSVAGRELMFFQKSPERKQLAQIMQTAYEENDGRDAIDENDAVKAHTFKLMAMDSYLDQCNKREKEYLNG